MPPLPPPSVAPGTENQARTWNMQASNGEAYRYPWSLTLVK